MLTWKMRATERPLGSGPQRYDVQVVGGEGSWSMRDPLTEMARVLVASGESPDDRLELVGDDGAVRISGRVGCLADVSVQENVKTGPRFGKFVPFDREQLTEQDESE